MKKFILPFLLVFLFSSFAVLPTPQVQAADCYLHADVPTNQSMKALGSVNLRNAPCMEGTTIVGGLVLDEIVTVTAVNDGWYKVKRQSGTEGWVWGEYLQDPAFVKPVPSTTTTTTTTTTPTTELKPQECYLHKDVVTTQTLRVTEGLNLRDGACLEGTKILTTLPQNTLVETLAVNGNWYKIKYNGFEGWAWGAYLSPSLSLTSTPTTPTTPIPPTTSAPSTSVFSDVQGHLYQKYIEALYPKVVTGYDNGTYGPEKFMNRAEYLTVTMRAREGGSANLPTEFNQVCFPDIIKDQFYTTSICFAKNQGIIAGHPDGLFRPGDRIDVAQAFKILAQTFQLPLKTPTATQQWYEPFVQALSDAKAIPPTIKEPTQFITRGEMAAATYSLLYKEALTNATQFNYFPQDPAPVAPVIPPAPSEPAPTQPPVEPAPPVSTTDLQVCIDEIPETGKVDYKTLSEKVLSMINEERTERGLQELKVNPVLNASSIAWANEGQFTHTRPNGLTLAEYEESIGVKSYGLLLENMGTFSFICEEDECSQTAINKAEKIHQSFMSEETNPLDQRLHFDAILNSKVTDFGFGFLVKGESIYMVYQFGSEVVGDADLLCKSLE